MGILLNFASKFVLNGKFDAAWDLAKFYLFSFVVASANLTSDILALKFSSNFA
nr:hypothetical protein [uncultured Campylobacter sp.]